MHIKLPYSEQSGHIPSADRLKVGELWINGADNIIGTKKQNEQVVQFAQLTPEQRERVLNDYIPKHGVVDKVSVGQTATKIEGKNDAVTINDDSDTAIEYTVTNSALTINIEKTTGHKATKLVISKPASQPVVITWNGVDHWLSTAGVPTFGESLELEELCVAIFTSSTINCVNVIYNTEAVGSTDDEVDWGMIGGSLYDQEDLQAALNSKLSVNVAAETYLKKTDKAESAKVADTVVGKNVTGVVAEATKATQLTTARTIAIGGAVTGAATSFNGTANITINTTAVNGAKVTGTVPAATKATQDGTGKVIATTYATKNEVTQGLAGKEDKGVCLPLTGGVMVGDIKSDPDRRELFIGHDYTEKQGALLSLRSYNHPESDLKGTFTLAARTPEQEAWLVGEPGGDLWWAHTAVTSVVGGGAGWVRFNFGVQICWGGVGIPANSINTIVNLPVPFVDTAYAVFTEYTDAVNTATVSTASSSFTPNSFKVAAANPGISWDRWVNWFAIGYWK